MKSGMLIYLFTGLVLGLSAGFSPGPLMALVLSQTLQHGTKDGLKAAVAPLVTDAPIILLSIFAISRLKDFQAAIGVISLIGAVFVFYLSIENLKVKKLNVLGNKTGSGSIVKGVLVNAMSPHPYLFWLTVGAPTVLKAMQQGFILAVLFVVGFILCLVGTKVFLAVFVGMRRHLLNDTAYIYVMRSLGILMLIFVFILIKDGLRLLGLFS